ncbi:MULTISPECIES: heavy-metal-associated domain-containing protein [Larkinella]|uniref:Copper chaperone n=1 Tax=Larkinella punicea TaxID=2315727 RepID=A0A368JHH0_9BACT|nr:MULTISPECIES: heavy-metal-associated domain-containing protein [Larkinella]RCR67107.1 copper chaperone [Larkinella punicea]
MEAVKFKTNIKCSGCIAKATPFLNEAVGAENWEVDTESPDKVLTVVAEGISAEQVKKAVENAGYKAEQLN